MKIPHKVIDIGKVFMYQSAEATFKLMNTGQGRLFIQKVSSREILNALKATENKANLAKYFSVLFLIGIIFTFANIENPMEEASTVPLITQIEIAGTGASYKRPMMVDTSTGGGRRY